MQRISYHTVPALVAAMLFACGIVVGRLLSLQSDALLLVSILVVLLGCLSFGAIKKGNAAVLVRAGVVVSCPILLGSLKIALDDASLRIVPREALKDPLVVIGTVLDPSPPQGNSIRFLFRADTLLQGEGLVVPLHSTWLVTVTRQRRDSLAPPLQYGERVMLCGKAYRPSLERNPGEFNARAYYEAQGIEYLMRVRGFTNVARQGVSRDVGVMGWMMKEIVVPLRAYFLSVVDRTIDGEEGELLKGIVIGERGGIPFSTRTVFVNAGIAHILAVSGSNVVVVCAFFAMLFGLLRVPRTPALMLNGAMLVVYMLVTGSQPPIVRATVMALVLLGSRLAGGKSNALNALGVAALLVLGWDARQLFDVGFQLSFAAVASILLFLPPLNARIVSLAGPALWRRGTVAALQVSAVTFVATLGTLPLTAVYFGKVSLVGLISNIVVLPVAGASVVLGFVTAFFASWAMTIAATFAAVNAWLLWLVLEAARISGNLSWAYVETMQFKPSFAVPVYLGMLLLYHFSLKQFSRVVLILLLGSLNLALVLPEHPLEKPSADRLRVSFIDVGQGDAALIEFPGGETMLIDAGMGSNEYDAGEQIVVPFLKRRGIARLDWFVASHPHADHIGGTPSVFRAFEVRELIESGQESPDPSALRYRAAVEREQCRVRTVRAFDSAMNIAGAAVYVLYPSAYRMSTDSLDRLSNLNNTSVVLKLLYGRVAFLFMGDVEREGEEELCRLFGEFLESDVLKAGHHGSTTSSTPGLLDLVKPKVAVISVGRNNSFHHPSEEIIDRLRSRGAEVLRTDEEGAIIFETDGASLERLVWR